MSLPKTFASAESFGKWPDGGKTSGNVGQNATASLSRNWQLCGGDRRNSMFSTGDKPQDMLQPRHFLVVLFRIDTSTGCLNDLRKTPKIRNDPKHMGRLLPDLPQLCHLC
jgi:hypothetical protein